MTFISGEIVSLFTFPGVIVHEAAHRFFCDLTKVPVYSVCYFRYGNPSGYVIHGEVKGIKNSFFICVGPLFVNTVLCALLTSTAVFPVMILKSENEPGIFYFLLWVGWSIGMHAFPSNQDMNNFSTQLKRYKSQNRTNNNLNVLYFIASIFSLLIKIANFLRMAWFDLFYAIGVSMALPLLFLQFTN